MLTWVLTGRGTKALAAAYFTIAALALLVATTTWVVVAAQHATGGIELVNREHRALVRGLAEGSLTAGQGANSPTLMVSPPAGDCSPLLLQPVTQSNKDSVTATKSCSRQFFIKL